MTTSATSLGWEIMTTCEAPQLGHGGAHAVVAEAVDAGVDTPVGGPEHPPDRLILPEPVNAAAMTNYCSFWPSVPSHGSTDK